MSDRAFIHGLAVGAIVGVEFIGLDNLRDWLMAAVRARQITPDIPSRRKS